MLCEIGTDEVVISIFSEQSDFPVVNLVEGHIHIVFDLADVGLSGGVHIEEPVLKAKRRLLHAVNKRDSFVSKDYGIVADYVGVTCNDGFVGEVGDGVVGWCESPSEDGIVSEDTQSNKCGSPSVVLTFKMIVSEA